MSRGVIAGELAPLTPFIGRAREADWLLERLGGGTRLITLTGIGGIGKTRLALHVAERVAAEREVHVVELAGLRGDDDPVAALAATLGVYGAPASLRAVGEYLRGSRALVVLDNCEHVADVARELARTVLRSSPDTRVLATSRVVLGLEEETVFTVPSLGLTAEDGGRSDAVELFLERVARVRPDLDGMGATTDVERIVRRVEGIPLAIELAAARARLLSFREIADGLRDALNVLGSPSRHAAARHRTMRASLDLSAELLSPADRRLFAQLSVFAPPFTVEAATEVCDGATLDGLGTLVDHSLLMVEHAGDGTRFRLPEFVRQYAAELLRPGQADALRARHRAYFLALAERADREAWACSPAGRRRLDADAPNLRAAARDATAGGGDDALWMVAWLGRFWRETGRHCEGVRIAEEALAATAPDATPQRALATSVLAILLLWRAEGERSLAAAEQAVALAEEAGDPRALAHASAQLGAVLGHLDPQGAVVPLQRGLELLAGIDDLPCESDLRTMLCFCAFWRADGVAFEEALPAAMRVNGRLGPSVNVRWVLHLAVFTELHHGRPEQARALLRRAEAPELGDDLNSVCALEACAAIVDAHTGTAAAGVERLGSLLPRAERHDVGAGTGALLNGLVTCTLAAGDLDAARRHLDALDTPRYGTFALRPYALEARMRVAVLDGDAGRTREHAAQLEALARSVGDGRFLGVAHQGAAWAAHLDGDAREAERLAKDALASLVEGGWTLAAIDGLELLAATAAAQADGARAARYLGAVVAARRERGLVRTTPPAPVCDAVEEQARGAVGDAAFGEAWEAGARSTLDDVLASALRGRGRRLPAAEGWESLSPVERRVAEHAATGLTNPEIARAVFVSRSTVKMHLSRIYSKLGVRSRVELAAALRDAVADASRG
ncbi:LuxR C-terminal-related transcriptional regulator [Patulibacter americanus]|uniref:LuxR C-terminal-related transcriptional regulator n=1 Tax=Patulibacter americanus TaxID=588672 RepID=UPI0003B36F3F|nr:LuxR C-terminal-related transcriptional regulator [Patulibacter americanus]